MKWPSSIQLVLDTTRPLKHGRATRLPLYLWPAMDPGPLSQAQAEELVRELERRGIGLVCRWDWVRRDDTLRRMLPFVK